METTGLEKKLIDIGYYALFQTHREEMEKDVWGFGANREEIEKIAYAKESSKLGRFLAAEILRHFNVRLKHPYYSLLSESYTYALKETNVDSGHYIGLTGNSWGFLYEQDDAGYLGKQIILFGEIAVPYLVGLLDIGGNVVYEGSRDATTGNAYQYRIKDFAAFYLSKIRHIPIKFYQDMEERDNEIERFKKRLTTS